MKESQDTRKIAIYSRKSKFTGKGESTSNQIELCKKKIAYQFANVNLLEDVLIYEDEGFTGYNTNRPAFQKMLQDIRENKIKVIAFYKLDRISRNVSDFSKLVTELEQYHVTFLSATESIENISPSGKAMMYMISVFAQLERDTIAERIKDNMVELAKTGRWLGGIPPTGYSSEQIETFHIDGKKRKLYKLAQNKDIEKVKTIFEKMLLFQSLTKLETYLLNFDYKTVNDKFFTRWSLKNILTNPVYAIADQDTFAYFKKFYTCVYANKKEFDGKHGLMVYNKTMKNTQSHTITKRNKEEWIVAVGRHQGLIDGESWVRIQEILEKNKDMRYRKNPSNTALFSGLLKCSKCHSYLRPKMRPKLVNEQIRRFDYICELKEKSHKMKCNCQNSNGLLIDSCVLKCILSLPFDSKKVCALLKEETKKIKKKKSCENTEIKKLKTCLKKNEQTIISLIRSLNDFDKDLVLEIKKEIRKLKEENIEIQTKINNICFSKRENDIDISQIAKQILTYHDYSLKDLEQKERIKILRQLIHTMTSDGKKVTIHFTTT